MNIQKIGIFITELRNEKNLTQHELAEQLYLTQSTISKWEKGLSYPDITKLEDLASALGVEVYDLLNGEKIVEPVPVQLEGVVNDIIDETKNLSEKHKKKCIKLWSIITLLLAIIICCGTFLVVDYYTSPPTFEVVDSYYSKSDEYETIYNIIIDYDGRVNDDYVSQYIWEHYEEYIKYTDVEAVQVMFYSRYKGKEYETSYTYITTFPISN